MQSSGGYKTLKILFFALLAGQVFLAGIALFLVQQKNLIGRPGLENSFLPVSIIFAFACIVISMSVFRKKVQRSSNTQQALADRFTEYRGISILRWALLEVPCLFAIISFMVTANNKFLLIAGIMLLIFVSTAPTKSKVSMHLGIAEQDLDELV